MNQSVVFLVYAACEMLPPWAYVTLCLSKRVHSIFVLRMFNDGVAMALAYAAVVAFQRRKWIAGSVVFSLGVSVKMNVLLMLPGLLVVLVGGASVGGGCGVGGRDARDASRLGRAVSDDLSKRISRPRLRARSSVHA